MLTVRAEAQVRLRLRSHMPARGIRVSPERDPEGFKVCPPRPLCVRLEQDPELASEPGRFGPFSRLRVASRVDSRAWRFFSLSQGAPHDRGGGEVADRSGLMRRAFWLLRLKDMAKL